MQSNTFQLVAKEIAAVMDVPAESLRPETSLAEIGMDSLEALQLLIVLEDATGIHLEEKDLTKFATVQSIVDLMDERTAAAA